MQRFLAWYRVGSSVGALVALIVANLVPLVGVLWFGWNVWAILIIYWLENGIVGLFNVLKMRRASGPEDVPAGGGSRAIARLTINGRPASGSEKAFLIPFFVMHYGLFWLVHGVFVLTLPLFASMGTGGELEFAPTLDPLAIAFVLAGLFISHGLSYVFNYIGRGEYLRTTAARQMFAPYGRLVILHVTILFGGLAIAISGAPAAAIVILVVLKTLMDLGFHLAEHRGPLVVETRATVVPGKEPG